MVTGLDDAVTPTDHARALFDQARTPKRLVRQRGTTHYAAYRQYAAEVIPLMVDWLRTYVAGDGRPRRDAEEIVIGPAAERTPA
jgi:hypothetical protein